MTESDSKQPLAAQSTAALLAELLARHAARAWFLGALWLYAVSDVSLRAARAVRRAEVPDELIARVLGASVGAWVLVGLVRAQLRERQRTDRASASRPAV